MFQGNKKSIAIFKKRKNPVNVQIVISIFLELSKDNRNILFVPLLVCQPCIYVSYDKK